MTHAEEATTTVQELRELRQTVNQQSRQIELLAEQVGKLTRALEGQKAPAAGVPMVPQGSVPTAPKVEFEPVTEGAKTEAAPKAEAVAPKPDGVDGPKHVVVKGETLTSIAKQYNITITELKTANKIENERKLQIGQTLTIPATKPPEPTDKKEKP